ncbi:MAG: hypothetical protein GY842_15200 [bacterium]|nr:hypothetical protein [bacterium]
MKSRVLAVALAGLIAAGIQVRAGADENQPAHTDKIDQHPLQRSIRSQGSVGAGLRFSELLRAKVLGDLDLTAEERQIIGEVFGDHVQAVSASTTGTADEPLRQDTEKRIQDLELQARAARRAGDRETALGLYRQLRELRRGIHQRDSVLKKQLTDDLVRTLSEIDSLDEEQISRIRQWARDIRAQLRGQKPLLAFMQKLRRLMGELALTGEQRQAVGTAVREAMRDLSVSREDPGVVAAVRGLLRPRIKTALGEELGESFMIALQEPKPTSEPRAGADLTPTTQGAAPASDLEDQSGG